MSVGIDNNKGTTNNNYDINIVLEENSGFRSDQDNAMSKIANDAILLSYLLHHQEQNFRKFSMYTSVRERGENFLTFRICKVHAFEFLSFDIK